MIPYFYFPTAPVHPYLNALEFLRVPSHNHENAAFGRLQFGITRCCHMGQHVRSHRGLYRLGGIQLDVVGAGELREEEDWIPPRPPAEWTTETLTLPGNEVTLTAFTLEHEHDAYRRLRREDKVRLIEERLRSLQ